MASAENRTIGRGDLSLLEQDLRQQHERPGILGILLGGALQVGQRIGETAVFLQQF